MERAEYVSYDAIVKELREYLADSPYLDYITFSGAGEPTLNSRIGDIVTFIKQEFPQYKLALITNSAFLPDKQLRDEVNQVDLILPSLDGASERIFKYINRPKAELKAEDVIQGLIDFRNESKAEMWLEIFFLPGVNDTKDELTLLKTAIEKIQPDKVQLNSLDRPGTEKWVIKESDEQLESIAKFLSPLPAEVITRTAFKGEFPNINAKTEDRILSTLQRRPCTVQDLTTILSLHINEINKYLAHLESKNLVTKNEEKTGIFYSVV